MRISGTVLLCLAIYACGDGTTTPGDDPEAFPTAMSIVGGNDQSDTVTSTLQEPLTVAVTTDEAGQPSVAFAAPGAVMAGDPMPGTLVNFVVTSPGCGQPFAGSALTDSAGLAADLWELGTQAGQCKMEVRAVSSGGQAMVFDTFSATALPGPVDSLALATTDTIAFLQTPLTLSGLVTVARDAFGNVVPDPAVQAVALPDGMTLVGGDTLVATAHVRGDVVFAADDAVATVDLTYLYDLSAHVWTTEALCTSPTVSHPGGTFEVLDSARATLMSDTVYYIRRGGAEPEVGVIFGWVGTAIEYGSSVDTVDVDDTEGGTVADSLGSTTLGTIDWTTGEVGQIVLDDTLRIENAHTCDYLYQSPSTVQTESNTLYATD